MTKIRMGCLAAAMALALLAAPPARTQDSQEKSLGDLAREQRDARKAQINAPDKTYTNEDLATVPDSPGAKDTDKVAAVDPQANTDSAPKPQDDPYPDTKPGDAKDATSAKPQDQPATDTKDAAPKKPAKPASHTTRPVTDRPKDTTPDFLIVPVGAEIKVDISEENANREPVHIVQGKVTVPVRVGFATAVPALSKATVQITTRYYDTGNEESVQLTYTCSALLTAVTVDGTTYDVESSEVSVGPTPGLTGEVTFVLQRALAIRR